MKQNLLSFLGLATLLSFMDSSLAIPSFPANSTQRALLSNNVRAGIVCLKGLGNLDKNGQFSLDPTYRDYQLSIYPEKALLTINNNLSTLFYPVAGNPFLTKDNKRFYRYTSNPPSFDPILWEVYYFIDDQIAHVYTLQRSGTSKPWRVGTALCPHQ